MMVKDRKRIYLAGGFKSGWQNTVFRELSDFEVLDPSTHNIEDPAAYTEWDLRAVRECDVILANMEESNPGGYALALEVGYAKALGKRIVFVDQIHDPIRKRYFEMIRQTSDRVFSTLADALAFISLEDGAAVVRTGI
jgi:nucleoside 2-deoxyribosyltransferase